jgi:hypothetical protein
MFCSSNIQYCLLLKVSNYKNLFCPDFIFLHLATENSARWQYRPALWYVLWLFWAAKVLDQLPFEGDLNW